MKLFRTIILTAFSFILFAVAGYGQTAANGKIGVINTNSFGDEKAGITKYISALRTLNIEFAPAQTELETLAKRLNDLNKEIQTLRDQAASGKVAVNDKAAQAKMDEAEKLQRDFKFKEEDARARFGRRQQVVLAPVMEDIAKAMQDYAKQKGFAVIFDIAKDEAGLLIMIADEKAEITKDFTAFYNARSGTPLTK